MQTEGNFDFYSDTYAEKFLTDKTAEDIWKDIPDPTTLVQPPETSQRNRPVDTYRARFMRGKEEEYTATIETYTAMATELKSNHFTALEECRMYAQFMREKISGEIKVFGSSCRDRWCPMCASAKASYAKEQTKMFIDSMEAPRTLCLTLRHNPGDLKSQIDFLTTSFRTLRQRMFWKNNVTGGIWFLQIKRGKNSGYWHPHLHIIIDGNRMEQGRLSALWEQVTHGSPVIDIRRIWDSGKIASYVARYSSRPANLASMPLLDRIEVIASLQGKRMCGTFGTGKTVTLTPPKIVSDSEWSVVGSYDKIMYDAKSDQHAKTIVRAYFNEDSISEEDFESYTGHPVTVELEPYEPPKPVQILLDFFQPK